MQATLEKPAAEQFIKDLQPVFARLCAQHQSEMVKRAMKSRLLQGYLPARPPLGYERTMVTGLFRPTRLGNGMGNILRRFAHSKLTVDEAMSQLRQLIETKTDRKMTRDKLLRLMRNPYYAGMLCCQGKQYLGKHAVLVTTEQHEAILELLNGLPEKSEGN